MQIVIDIPEELYKKIKENGYTYRELPKGHGRLIDADTLIKTYDGFVGYDEEIQLLKDADTIIEADTESER